MRAHRDKLNDKTYAIKVGKNIPANGINLAYVDSDDLSPQANISIVDCSEKKDSSTVEMTAEPKQDFVLYSVANGNSYMPTDSIEITDEFSIREVPSDPNTPLYYKAHLSKPFSLSNFGIIKNPGYTDRLSSSLKSDDSLVPTNADTSFLYLGDKIRVTNNGVFVPTNMYKVVLTRDGANQAQADIYTNFRNAVGTKYQVTYQSTTGMVTETLNAYPFFTKDDELISELLDETNMGADYDPRLDHKVYTVRQQGSKYQVYAPTHMLVADKDARPAQRFRYKLQGNINVRYSIDKTCTLNVGLLYLNALPNGEAWSNAENISDILAKLHNHPDLPSYVTLDNPHHSLAGIGSGQVGPDEKNNPNYWLINMESPEEFINDYDVIIITGYGQYDITSYNYIFRRFLEQGGAIWIDNASNDISALSLSLDSNEFVVDIKFNTNAATDNQTLKSIADSTHPAFNRVWQINSSTNLGYKNIGPLIVFGPTEEAAYVIGDWKVIVKYDNENPCVIQKQFFEKGTVVVSNCGLMRAGHATEGEADDVKFIINMLLGLKENKWLFTPWINDTVLNAPNVFANEYSAGKEGFYEESYHINDSNTKVARKLLHESVMSGLQEYTTIEDEIVNGTYSIQIEQLAENEDNMMVYQRTGNIFNFPITSAQSPVYIYTLIGGGNNTTNITSDVLKNGYLKLYYEPIDLTYTIYAFQYVWSTQYNRYDKAYKVSKTSTVTLSKENGIIDLGLFEKLLPDLASDMSETDKIYFQVSMSYIDKKTGSITYLDLPANIDLYDAQTGKFVYDANGDSVISWLDLYHGDNASFIKLYAWTNYQTIAANTRRFSVKAVDGDSIYVVGPATIDESQPWYLRVFNGTYYEDTYTNGPTSLKVQYQYEIPEYYNQVFNPVSPYVKVTNDKVYYIDYHQVSVSSRDLYVDRGSIDQETLTLLKPGVYKTQHGSITPVYDNTGTLISPYVWDDNGQLNDIDIDYEYGIVRVNSDVVGIAYIKYQWNNISAFRRKYGKQGAQKEQLIRLDYNSFQAKHYPILMEQTPKIYIKPLGQPMEQLPSAEMYTIDYENGIITLENGTAADVFMSYNYSVNEPLTISDYDTINGYLTFNESINFTDEIYATYHCVEKYYQYRGYLDPDGIFRHLDLNPSEGHSFVFNGMDTPTSSLMNKTVYVYMVPRAINNLMYYTRIPNNIVAVQDGNPVVNIVDSKSPWDDVIQPISYRTNQLSYIPYRYIQNLRLLTGDISPTVDDPNKPDNTLNTALMEEIYKPPYIDSTMGLVPVVLQNTNQALYKDQVIVGGYLINNYTVRHTFDKDELDAILKNTAGAKLLAKITLNDTRFDVTVIDARKRGGGLKETIPQKEIDKRNGGLNLSYWDISTWDGIAYQKNGTIIVTLPKEVLKEYGGKFTKAQVDDYIKQYIALGVFWIVEYK